jgi:hypothetical protein
MRCTRVLPRRPKGEELRAVEAGGKNGWRASARRELQDIAVRNRICLGYNEIARAVKSQAPRVSKPSSISALNAGWTELENCVASRARISAAKRLPRRDTNFTDLDQLISKVVLVLRNS